MHPDRTSRAAPLEKLRTRDLGGREVPAEVRREMSHVHDAPEHRILPAVGDALALAAASDGSEIVTAIKGQYAVFRWTGSWAKANIGTGGTLNGDTEPQVVRCEQAGLYCWSGCDSVGGGVDGRTSPTGATWTARTMTNQASHGGTSRMACRPTDGRIVLMSQPNGAAAAIKVHTSDDGGVTWTQQSDLSTGVTSGSGPEYHLSADPLTGVYCYVIGRSSGATQECEVWTSPDGATWTKKATLANYALHRPAGVGGLWVAQARNPTGVGDAIVYSPDGGATWRIASYTPPGTAKGIFANRRGRLLQLRTAAAAIGVAPGLENAVTLT